MTSSTSILLVKPNSVHYKTVVDRVGIDSSSIGQLKVMSNLGTGLDLDQDQSNPYHIFARGNQKFDVIHISGEYPVMYGNSFTLFWINDLLKMLSQSGEIRIEIFNDKRNERLGLISSKLLNNTFSGVKSISKTIIALTASSTLKNSNLKSIYPVIRNNLTSFVDQLVENNQVSNMPSRNKAEAEKAFIYGVFGANQKGFLMETLMTKYNLIQPVTGLDLGGGYGLMAMELGCSGHQITVLDYDSRKMQVIAPWVAEVCDTLDKVSFEVSTIEEVVDHSQQYDFVSLFGALLYADRTRVATALNHCGKLLKPGGLLIIHENPKDVAKPGTPDYDKKFTCDDLVTLMTNAVAEPKFYNMFTGSEISQSQAAQSVMMAVSQKV